MRPFTVCLSVCLSLKGISLLYEVQGCMLELWINFFFQAHPICPLFLIDHVRYINILTWLRGFQVKLLYSMLFLLYPTLLWELKDKRDLKNFDPKASEPCLNIDISNVTYCKNHNLQYITDSLFFSLFLYLACITIMPWCNFPHNKQKYNTLSNERCW